jgi:type II secretory pathway pseudopilin PulG
VIPALNNAANINAGGRTAARSGRHGMTLIEITMVVLLLGLFIVAIASLGYFAFRDKEQLKDEARTLAGTLEHVRTLAALNGKRYVVQYNLDEEEQMYFVWVPRRAEEGEVFEEDDEDVRVASGFHAMPSRRGADGRHYYAVWIDRIAYGDGKEVKRDEVKIDFLPSGGGHWHYVYLTNVEGEFYTVEVNPFTGFAEVYPGELKPEPPEKLR